MTCDVRLVLCEYCGTEGRIYQMEYGYDRERGSYYEPCDVGPCPECNGTGKALVAVQPIELEDLDEMS